MNHDGSSESMESLLGLQLVQSIANEWKGRVHIAEVISNDDSKLRSKLQHISNGGLLSEDTPEPAFICDPGHRTKVMAKKIFAMVKNNKDIKSVKKIDALRLKNTFLVISHKQEKVPSKTLSQTSGPPSNIYSTPTSSMTRHGVGRNQ